jgi:hypothetical protein
MEAAKIKIGQQYRFYCSIKSPPGSDVFITLTKQHSGQIVKVVEEKDGIIFTIRAKDGWLGSAFAHELEEK